MLFYNRRDFIGGSALFAASGMVRTVSADVSSGAGGRLVASAPMLQVPADTTMGVVWAVGTMAKGVVEVSEHPDMSEAHAFRCGGFGVNGFDDKVLSARLSGLKPATRYWYRTKTTRLIYERGGYHRELGETETSPVYTFTTTGAAAESRFAVLNDTHMRWESFQMVAHKLKELSPPIALWNGDALNSTDTVDEVVKALLAPKVADADYAANMPVLFNNGNHEYRGLYMRNPYNVILPRLASERRPEDEALVRNFAIRQGDIAILGLDTGEDRPDDHPWHAGLSNCAAYISAQAKWLDYALSRPDIASAPYVVASCHIPLLPRTSERDNPMWWSEAAAREWGPQFTRHGVQAVIVGHMHEYRCDMADATRSWAQIEGGGFERGERFIGGKSVKNPGYFPTVMEGKVDGGRLVVTVYDAWHGRVAGRHEFAPRRVSGKCVAQGRKFEEPSP